jgi:hypothetical protein
MNRRHFLGLIGGVIITSVCPQIVVPRHTRSIVPVRIRPPWERLVMFSTPNGADNWIEREFLEPRGARWYETPYIQSTYIPLLTTENTTSSEYFSTI